jgi:hypothetical protein
MPWLATNGSTGVPLLFAGAFLWVSLAIGRRLLLVLRASGEGTQAERGVIAAGLGAGALQFVPFTLGAMGLLGTSSVRIAAGVIVLAAAKDMWAVALAVSRGVRQFVRPDTWVLSWVASLLPCLVFAGLVALAPTTDPDGVAYHLTVPKLWLQSGWLRYLPTYPYSNAPMGAEMLFTLGLAFAGDIAAKCMHFTLGVAGVIGLYFAGKRLNGPVAGAIAATLYLVGPAAVCPFLGWAYVEGIASFAMIAASLAWILWFRSGDRGYLRSAALLAGFAVSCKLTAALFPAALLALTYVAARDTTRGGADRDRRPAVGLALLARLVPFVLAAIVPWMARSTIVTGNPVFPLFARWIPSRDFSPDLSTKFDRFNRFMTWASIMGRGWTVEQRAWFLLGVCAMIAVVGGLVSFRMRSWMARGTAAVVTLVVIAQLSAAGLYVRYSIPLAAVLGLPIVAAFGSSLSRRGPAVAWLGVTVLGSMIQARRCVAQQSLAIAELARTTMGLEDKEVFRHRHVGLYTLYEQVNRDLPRDAKVMLSVYCGGFYIDRTTFCAEMVQNSLRFTTWDAFTSDLRRLGITHVIAPRVLATEAPFPPLPESSTSSITREAQYRAVRRLLVNHSLRIGDAADQGLYELDTSILEASGGAR